MTGVLPCSCVFADLSRAAHAEVKETWLPPPGLFAPWGNRFRWRHLSFLSRMSPLLLSPMSVPRLCLSLPAGKYPTQKILRIGYKIMINARRRSSWNRPAGIAGLTWGRGLKRHCIEFTSHRAQISVRRGDISHQPSGVSSLPAASGIFFPGSGPTWVLSGSFARSAAPLEKEITNGVPQAFSCHPSRFTLRWPISCVGGAVLTESEILKAFNAEDEWTVLGDRIMRVGGMLDCQTF